MMLLLLLMAGQADADKALNRYTQFMDRAKTLSMSIHAQAGDHGPIGDGMMAFKRPSNLFFKMSVGPEDYVYAYTQQGGVELDRFRELYDEIEYPGSLSFEDSNISNTLGLGMQEVFLRDNLRGLTPKGTPWTLDGKATADGVTYDVVSSHYGNKRSGMGVYGDISAGVDDQGHLVMLKIFRFDSGSTLDLRYQLSHHIANSVLNQQMFTVTVPNGYTPYSMPSHGDPISQGEPVPLGKWVDTASGAHLDLAALARNKPALVVVADADSPPSMGLLSAIGPLAVRIKAIGGVFAVIGAGTDREAARRLHVVGTVYDPTGRQLDALHVPGAPLVYLVGRDGKLVQAWMGYDSNGKNALLTEMRTAFAKAGIR